MSSLFDRLANLSRRFTAESYGKYLVVHALLLRLLWRESREVHQRDARRLGTMQDRIGRGTAMGLLLPGARQPAEHAKRVSATSAPQHHRRAERLSGKVRVRVRVRGHGCGSRASL
jgi:hypothetical protein